ncbi:MAG: LLM class F420-dependent oxidoreductase, partial [Sciscionella sp.]
VEDSAAAFDRVRELAAANGRELSYSVAQEIACGKDASMVQRRAALFGRAEGVLENNGLHGSPAQVVDKLGRLAEIGASRVYLRVLDLDDLDHLELLGAEVLPQLR